MADGAVSRDGAIRFVVRWQAGITRAGACIARLRGLICLDLLDLLAIGGCRRSRGTSTEAARWHA